MFATNVLSGFTCQVNLNWPLYRSPVRTESLKIDRVLDGEPYAFNGPRYMDFDSDGRMYVADKYANKIKIIAPDGTLLQVIGTDRSGKGEGVFDRPEGVEIRGADIWFSDTYNDRIVRYRVSGP